MSVARPRRSLVALLVVLLLAGPALVVSAPPAAAAPTPWNWVKASTVGSGNGQGNWVTTTCPAGYRVVTGGWDYSSAISSAQVVGGTSFRVQAFITVPLTVTAWCARTDQVDLQVTDRTLQTSQDTGDGPGRGLADLACDGDRTPVGASFTWTSPGDAQFAYVLQSGPETIGGVNEWFVTASAPRTASVLDVKLQCVANADLAGAAWYRVTGVTGSSDQTTASCPAQQRFVTGGEHIDSIVGIVHTSTSVDTTSWTTKATVLAGDTLTVSVLCVPAGDPVATITRGPPRVSDSSSAFFTFTAVDPAGGTAHDYCFLNTSGLGPCDGAYTVHDLTEGQNEQDYYFWVDLTPPKVSFAPTPLFTLGGSLSLTAKGTDAVGVDHYALTVTAEKAWGTDAATTTPVTTSYTSASGSISVPGKRATSNHVRATAYDTATNASAPVGLDTAVPLDNLDLDASPGWTLISKTLYTNHLVSRSTTRGATLTRTMCGTTLGVVATTAPTGGTVGVYVGSRLVTTLDLHAAATHYQVVFPVKVGTADAAMKVTLKVASSNKLVEIDGLGAVVR